MSEKNHGFICPECKEFFKNPDDLSNHFQTRHIIHKNIIETDNKKLIDPEIYEQRIIRQKDHIIKQNEVIKELTNTINEMKNLNELNEARFDSTQQIMRDEIKNLNSEIATIKHDYSLLVAENKQLLLSHHTQQAGGGHVHNNNVNNRLLISDNNPIELQTIDKINPQTIENMETIDNYNPLDTDNTFSLIRNDIELIKNNFTNNILEISQLINNIKIKYNNKLNEVIDKSKQDNELIRKHEEINKTNIDQISNLKLKLNCYNDIDIKNNKNIEQIQELNSIIVDLTDTIDNLKTINDNKIETVNIEKNGLKNDLNDLNNKIIELNNIIDSKNKTIEELNVDNLILKNKYSNDYILKNDVENQIKKIKSDYEIKLNEMIRELKRITENHRVLSVDYEGLVLGKSEVDRSFSETVKHLDLINNENITLKQQLFNKEQNINEMKNELKIKEQKMHDNILALCELGAQNQKLQEISSSLLGKSWKNDNLIDKCELCSKLFTLTIRKHHCRACGGVFCNICSEKSIYLPCSKNSVRVCEICYDKLSSYIS